MKIRMQALAAGPSGTWQPGQIVEVPEAVGLRLVAGGYAVDLGPKPALTEPEDTAAPAAPEQAVIVLKKRH